MGQGRRQAARGTCSSPTQHQGFVPHWRGGAMAAPGHFLGTCSSADPRMLPTDRCLCYLQQGKHLGLHNPTTDLAGGEGRKPLKNGLLSADLLNSPLIIYLCPLPGWLFKGSFISITTSPNFNFGRRQPCERSTLSLLPIYLY